MKKILFGLGTVAAVVAPVVSVVACGDDTPATPAETKINGKTATEIKALSADDFTTFLNDTLHKAQPETDPQGNDAKNEGQRKIKFTVSANKKELTYTDSNGQDSKLDVSDTTKPEFLAALGIYTSTTVGRGATPAESHQGGEVKAWWKDVVEASKIYFAN